MHTLNSAERFSSIKNSMKKTRAWWALCELLSRSSVDFNRERFLRTAALYRRSARSRKKFATRLPPFLKQANFRGSSWKENRKIYNSARLLQKFRFSFSIPLKINTMFMTGYNRPVPRIYDVGIKSLTKQNALFSPKNLWLFPKNLPIWRSNVESLRGKL